MENENLLNLVVSLIIGVIITGVVLIPVINDIQDDLENIHYNGDNEYCVRMSYGHPDTDQLLFHKPANEMFVECYWGSDATEPYYIAPLNTVGQMGWVFCSSSYSLGITGYAPQPLDSTSKYNNQGAGGYNTLADEKSVRITVATGKIVTWGADPNNTWAYYDNADMDHCFWADPEGDYINIQVNKGTTYIENPKAIAGSSQTQGNYVFYTDTDNVTVTNNKSAIISTETTEKNGLYRLTKVPMQITGLDDSVNNVTSAHVIVEYKVQGDPAPGGLATLGLLDVIPLLVVIGLVLAAAGAIYIRDRD